jgi:hypothetical protein
MPVTVLVDRIPEGHVLYLNPTGPAPMVMDVESLRASVAELGGWPGGLYFATSSSDAAKSADQLNDEHHSCEGRWRADGAHGIG